MQLSNKSVAGGMAALLMAASVSAGGRDLRLIQAVKDQDHETVRVLLEQKADVNTREGDGATALHWAVLRDDVEAVQGLLRAGADVNAANDYGVTPVALACTNRNATVVKKLLAAGADPNAATLMGETALMTCARTGTADAVVALFDHGANNVNAREKSHGQTALMWAAARGYPEVVRALLAQGADVHARSDSHLLLVRLGSRGGEGAKHPQRGFTPLLFAARQGDEPGRIESARLLLEAGADVNETAPDGASALVVASHSGQGTFAAFLLEHGAKPDAAGAGYAALHAAVLRGDLELVKALCGHGADPNVRLTKGSQAQRSSTWFTLPALVGATPFLLAAKYLELEIMRFLVANGADPLLSAENGTTALMAVAGAGWLPTGADPQNRRNQTVPVEVARQITADERPTWEGTKLALELGIDVNAADSKGDTALHVAVSQAFSTVVQLLVEHGGKLDIKNKRDITAQDVACRDPAGQLVRCSNTNFRREREGR